MENGDTNAAAEGAVMDVDRARKTIARRVSKMIPMLEKRLSRYGITVAGEQVNFGAKGRMMIYEFTFGHEDFEIGLRAMVIMGSDEYWYFPKNPINGNTRITGTSFHLSTTNAPQRMRNAIVRSVRERFGELTQ